MFRKLISLWLACIFVFSRPVDGLASQIRWYGENDAPAGGMGFFLDPGNAAHSRYLLRGPQGALWLSGDAIWLTHLEARPAKEKGISSRETETAPSRRGVNLKITFPGANPKVRLVAEQQMSGQVSFLHGNDPQKWATGLPLWGQVRYQGLYPGVDLVVRSTAGGFTWAYEVQPGADTSWLRMQVQGAQSLRVTDAGTLAQTEIGEIALPPLDLDGATIAQIQSAPVAANDGSDTLEIYPVYAAPGWNALDTPARLDYSTLLGGSEGDTAYDVAVDSSGAAYLVGETYSPNFPGTAGFYDTTQVMTEVFAVKLQPHGAGLSYATYLGGSNDETGANVAVDGGVAYITGETYSTDFPITTGSNVIDGDVDAFVTALNATGTGLIYSRMLGGSSEDHGYAIAVQGGSAYVTGMTGSSDFLGGSYATNGEIFVVKLASNGALSYTRVTGGEQVDAGFAIAVVNGAAWVTGETWSIRSFNPTPYGNDDVFILSLSATGTVATLNGYGGVGEDSGRGIVLDGSGNIYVTGKTASADFGFTEGALTGSNDAFLLKVNSTNSQIQYATALGGSGNDEGKAIALDTLGGVVVVGFTSAAGFPVTADAYQSTPGGGSDGFVTRFLLTGAYAGHRAYSSFLGGSGNDEIFSVALDPTVFAYLAGQTRSANFPTTSDGLYHTLNGIRDAFFTVMGIGPVPKVSLTKTTNNQDVSSAPGVYLPVNQPVTWRYLVQNTGELPLTNVTVTDSKGVNIDCDSGTNTSTDHIIASLAAGASVTCLATGTSTAGQYTNLGSVTANTPYSSTISSSDSSYYFGATPGTSLVKRTNGVDANTTPGVYVVPESQVNWTYEIKNTGNVDLTNVTVIDNNGTPGSTADDITVCTISLLPAGVTDSSTCQMIGVAKAGQYTNIAVVTGTPPGNLANVSDDDPSNYYGSAPALTLTKKINDTHVTAAPGPYLLVGATITWKYEVTNSGNVPLTNVTVVDDKGVNIDCDGGTNTTTDHIIANLAAGASVTCTAPGTATIDQYHNIATVTGSAPVPGQTTTATDDSFYFGAQPTLTLEYAVNTTPADSAPGIYVPSGSTLNLSYLVTNTGNVPLTNIIIKDDNGTPANTTDDFTCPMIASLAMNASDNTCSRTLTALTGQRNHLTTVTATPPSPLANASTSDPMYYFGATTSVTLLKKTNGVDIDTTPEVYVLVSAPVTWTYLVTNTSNVPLSQLTVTDNRPVDIDCDGGTNTASDHIIASLAVNASVTCTASGTAALGSYTNTGSVTANPPSPLPAVNASDTSHYFGTSLNVTLVKKTNGLDAETAPGPLVGEGQPVAWTYLVTNNSNVSVNYAVVDDNGTPTNSADNVTVCTGSLAAGVNTTCTRNGTAVAGQYTNVAIVTATPPGSLSPVTAQDTSHYFGVSASVDIIKYTNTLDANTTPGPYIHVGDPVNWTYKVTNTGNILLTQVTVTDNKGVNIDCDGGTNTANDHIIASLAPGASVTCAASGTSVAGQYENTGSVTGNPPTGFNPVSDSDLSHYFGSTAGVNLEKWTNGVDAVSAPGPYILVGQPVTWRYMVTNTGNIALNNITVTDDKGVTVTCPKTALAVNESMDCTAGGIAIAGQYTNTGTVQAHPITESGNSYVYDYDTSYYFGANPAIHLVKKTNGDDANTPPGPYIPVDGTANFTYEVSNAGNIALSGVTVTDGDANVIPVYVSGDANHNNSLDLPETWIFAASALADTGSKVTSASADAKGVHPVYLTDFGSASDSDLAWYFGYSLGIALEKYTNGVRATQAPGPTVLAGTLVTWTYKVTNTSNVKFDQVEVSDDKGVVVRCPKGTLDVAEVMTCTGTGLGLEQAYTNKGTATGTFQGDSVKANDVSHYQGIHAEHIHIPIVRR
jgi:uncharacterized repeat protein (TIGR01451 family)